MLDPSVHAVPPSSLDLRQRTIGTTRVVAVAGDLDIAGIATVEEALGAAIDAHPERVVVDLSELEFIDSTGLCLVLRCVRRARAHHVELLLIPGRPAVRRVFETAQLDGELPFLKEPTQ